MSTTRFLRPTTFLATAATRVALAAFLGAPGAAAGDAAHLSIIRQGPESRGAIESNDEFGRALAAGDFDGDGFDDLATGAPGENLGTPPWFNGAVIVSYGTERGLTHVGADLLTPQGTLSNGSDSLFGLALAAADFDQDGYDDLAVGAPSADVGATESAGMVFLYRGGPGGLSSLALTLDQSDGGGGIEAFDAFGSALAAGKLDSDKYPDLVVGSTGEDAKAGAVFYFFGTAPGGLKTTGAGWFKQSSLGGTNVAGDQFGTTVAVANLYGSSYGEIAVSAPYKDIGAKTNAGLVYLIPGTSGGPTAAGAKSFQIKDLGKSEESNAYLGWALAAGRFYDSTTGHLSLAIGQPGGNLTKGRVLVAKGAFDGLLIGSAIELTQASAGISADADDDFGTALAAGDWDGDGFDDIAVGAPGEDFITINDTDAGEVHVFLGKKTGPSGSGAQSFLQETLGDDGKAGDQLGDALVFGLFDDSGRANLAAGAPFKDNSGSQTDSGQVFVIAPWRQVMGLIGRHSIAMDCGGDFVFSQKPFDPVYIASTTKTMTVLIASERSQLSPADPKHVDLSTVYTVPKWVSDDVGGSQFGLMEGEPMTLLDLMRTCMAVSGNDCAFAIADLLTGGGAVWNGCDSDAPGGTVYAFVQEMNARAAQLGMSKTHFTNPAGLDCGDPQSTAYDMYLLSRAAMQNALFADIVGTAKWNVTHWVPFFDGHIVMPDFVYNGFFINGQANLSLVTGIKGGGTPNAKVTGLFSARQDQYPWGTAIAGSYQNFIGSSAFWPNAADLLKLGLAECGTYTIGALLDGWAQAGGISSKQGQMQALSTDPGVPPSGKLLVELHNEDLALAPRFDLHIAHESQVELEPGATARFLTAPFHSHDGIDIRNEGDAPVSLYVTPGQPGVDPSTFTLKPGETGVIKAYASSVTLPSFTTSVRNLSTFAVASLSVSEKGYGHSVSLGSAIGNPNEYPVLLAIDPAVSEHKLRVQVAGKDTGPAGSAAVVVRDAAAPFTFEPHPAAWHNYGAGWPGTNGVPALTADAAPTLGGVVKLNLGNSAGAAAPTLLCVGSAPAAIDLGLGGTLHVVLGTVFPLGVPATGKVLTYAVPADPFLVGTTAYAQILQLDLGASSHVSFSRGLLLAHGY